MPFTHDPNLYTSIPTRTPAGTLSLFRALVAAAHPQPLAVVAQRLTKLHGKAKALQKDWIDANRPDTGESVRTHDNAVDRCWGALRDRMQPWVDIDVEPHGKRAAELIELLFPTGLDFLTLSGPEQWSESDRRLVLIESDQLEPDINELAGEVFLTRLRAAHAQHGDALGITKAKAPQANTRVIDSLRDLRAEIAGYARLVLGLADEDDEQSAAAAEAQLEPILRYRKPKSAGGEDEGDEPVEAPLPDVPSGE